eukprot:3134509-Prymnesium_polylepis.1
MAAHMCQAAHPAACRLGGGLVHFTLVSDRGHYCRAFDVRVRFWGVVVRARARGATQHVTTLPDPPSLAAPREAEGVRLGPLCLWAG